MTDIYQWADNSKTQIAHYSNGTVTFLSPEDAPSGIKIIESWSQEDAANFQRERDIEVENAWRLAEIRKCADRIEQIKNDAEFNIKTYTGIYSKEDFNRYRVALITYADDDKFPYNTRPILIKSEKNEQNTL